jgi:hypothetical protein
MFPGSEVQQQQTIECCTFPGSESQQQQTIMEVKHNNNNNKY